MRIYSEEEIKNKLHLALEKLYVKDWYLLEKSVHERSITHKLAEYLQPLFPDYDVDCEYNNNIDDRKKWVSEEAKDLLKEKLSEIKNSLNPQNWDLDEEIDKLSKNFYPDIIVHKRNTNKCNLLIIEAKKYGSDQAFDEEKIKAFTNTTDNIHKYKYQLGALVTFDTGEYFKGKGNFTLPIYFKDGKNELKTTSK